MNVRRLYKVYLRVSTYNNIDYRDCGFIGKVSYVVGSSFADIEEVIPSEIIQQLEYCGKIISVT